MIYLRGFYNESIPVKAVKVPGKILEFLCLSSIQNKFHGDLRRSAKGGWAENHVSFPKYSIISQKYTISWE